MPISCRNSFQNIRICANDRFADLIGLGRSAVLEPELPRKVLLNPAYDDEGSVAMSHIVRGQWFSNMIPIKVVGGGLPIQFFYYNMRRLGKGLKSDPNISIPGVLWANIVETFHKGVLGTLQSLISAVNGSKKIHED